ncbi:MAG: hypothetical protein HY964_06600 [Ignavibacteriales bacterium]|nr:hypothetical protein [Ignavibacteriales bacterium]
MKKLNLIIPLLIFVPIFIYGQEKFQLQFDHSLNSINHFQLVAEVKPESLLNILAVMVEFQPDNDSRTTGNGAFDLRDTSKKFLDAPPHERNYFYHHLTFLKNYYRKVSKGKLNITFKLMDSVYRLPHEMRHYSPPKNSKTNMELGWLVYDTWKSVDSIASATDQQINYSDYNAFLIFHAGVGRDIDLVSLYGYDPTPYDLPSLYVNFKTMFTDSLSNGVPVGGGSYYITNSMVLPETETREQVPFPLGINGLLVASVASRLGLPDLFNTKNGRSAIGRFGLMDGQAIFSWNGAFPPEPSAWEKQYLGWINPVEVKSSDSIFNLSAKSLINSVDTTLKVNISAGEYFLLENRDRDANRDGAIITMVVGNDTIQKHWLRDTLNFNSIDLDSLYGSIIDVDEFDWSLPGGVDSRTKIFYHGGILIWHIDESIINSNLETNSINADPKRRGVNLMEADGSPDIGQSYDLLHPGSGSESGTALDFWFDGNSAPLRKYDTTGFNPTSYPNSMSNAGANSHIYINHFSESGPRMSVRVRIGDNEISPLSNFPKFLNTGFRCNSITSLSPEYGNAGIILTANPVSATHDSAGYQPPAIYGWNFDGSPLVNQVESTPLLQSIQLLDGKFFGKLAVGDFSDDLVKELAGGVVTNNMDQKSILSFWALRDTQPDDMLDTIYSYSILKQISTSPVVSDSFIVYGTKTGLMYLVNKGINLSVADSIHVFDSTEIVGITLIGSNQFAVLSAMGEMRIVSLYTDQVLSDIKHFGYRFNSPAASGLLSGSDYWKNEIGNCITFVSSDGYVFLTDSKLNLLKGFPVSTNGVVSNAPAIGDVDGDNIKDIVLFSDNKIFAVNATGAILDNFPITVTTEKPILSSPVLGDVNGDGLTDIVAVTQEGLVVAYSKTGRMTEGFPLLSGPNSGSTPAIFYLSSICLSCTDIGLAVGSDDGYLYAWQTGSLPSGLLAPPVLPWPQYLHDARNTGLSSDVYLPTSKSSNFMPQDRAYNWPNPVTAKDDFKTHFRYYTATDANVKIKIIDQAGDLVTQFDVHSIGGIDNEFVWDASGLQSGIYFVHLDATGSMQSGHSIFKMAIIR